MKTFFKKFGGRLGLLGQLFAYLWRERRFGLIVVVVFLALLSLLMIAAQSGGVAPFIYTLF